MNEDLSRLSMLDLFRMELETQTHVLISNLLTLERDPSAADSLEAAMRAAHSLKGAARIVGVAAAVRIAHAMEECFVAAQRGTTTLSQPGIDALLDAVDLLVRIGATPDDDIARWEHEKRADVDTVLSSLARTMDQHAATEAATAAPQPPPAKHAIAADDEPRAAVDTRDTDRVLRVTAENLNRLLGLAGESLVEARWLQPFAQSLAGLKRHHHIASATLDRAAEALLTHEIDPEAEAEIAAARRELLECEQALAHRLTELEQFNRRSTSLSQRLYDEAVAVRMRPFADGVHGLPRTVRDLARSLGKQVRLEIVGDATRVDRDVLARLDAPLSHLLGNAVDHGIESPEERRASGKPPEGVIRLEARHSAGALHIVVSDDGRGIDLDRVRHTVVRRQLASAASARAMSEAELLEFLFLPGFTVKETVTDLSGRGVGLDVVQNMVKAVRGTIRVTTRAGHGTAFQMQLPVTLSVVRTLLAEIAGEPYAFLLARIVRVLKVPRASVDVVEGRSHFTFDGRSIGLVTAHQIFDLDRHRAEADDLSVVVIGDALQTYGIVVDRFLGERELVVQTLDAQLGKINGIAAGALMDDGSPVLIVDNDDLLRAIERIVSTGRVSTAGARDAATAAKKPRKRVLVVDDSLTVRELERKLLANSGYDVEVAVDGVDGWNAVRTGRFDLVVTDVDMPRMDGIELVASINKDPKLKSLPVMVVSYKDREEDRRRGLDAGAARYLTKSSFHDETLVQAVADLIGEADA